MTVPLVPPRPAPPADDFTAVCPVGRLHPDRGVAALVAGRPVALFRLGDGSLHAIDAVDPFSGAAVLARGLVGDAGGEPTVASPLYKQRFSLRTGACLDDPAGRVRVHEVRCRDGIVEVRCDRGEGAGR